MVTEAAPSTSRHGRVRALLAAGSLVAGGAAIAAAVLLAFRHGTAPKELPWLAGSAIFLLAAAYVWRRIPRHRVAWWFAVTSGPVALVQATDGWVERVASGGDLERLAWVVLSFHLLMAVGGIAIAHLLGLFPDGRIERTYERRILRAAWLVLLLPPLVALGRETLLLPTYHQLPDLVNPNHVPALTPIGGIATIGVVLLQGVFAVGVVLLALRYRRGGTARRRRIRWLLVPAIFAAVVAAIDIVAWWLFPAGPPSLAAEIALSVLWIAAIASVPLAIAVALLRPDLLDVDRVIRQSLVYGALWSLIALTYAAAAAGLGVVAGQRFPVTVAIVLTVVATLLFQPARQRLEGLADRWVFGDRTDPAQLVARLGETLADTFDLESLLPRMAATLEEGLGLRWARVRLDTTGHVEGSDPVLTVPIVLGGETLGVVECGPRVAGALTPEDEVVVETLARQAALAVRNVRLTTALTAQAEELATSRTRLVRAQESERRRIERNIHDGAQQDLIALIGLAGRLRGALDRDPGAGAEVIEELQEGLRRVIGELRELAHGIHPSLLSDRGLLEAVEALAARSVVPVEVRADPSLRGERFAEAIEGAGYFTVAESLANVGKHAAAERARVTLARSNGSLRIEVRDDGAGFDPDAAGGEGLDNLAARIAAIGGRLEVSSRPGAGTTVAASLAVDDPEGTTDV